MYEYSRSHQITPVKQLEVHRLLIFRVLVNKINYTRCGYQWQKWPYYHNGCPSSSAHRFTIRIVIHFYYFDVYFNKQDWIYVILLADIYSGKWRANLEVNLHQKLQRIVFTMIDDLCIYKVIFFRSYTDEACLMIVMHCLWYNMFNDKL